MNVRFFDPVIDDPKELGHLNPFSEAWQNWMSKSYTDYISMLDKSVVVAEDNGQLVGVLHIFDVGLPWTILDGMFLKPQYRTLANARKLGYFAVNELKRRGVNVMSIYAEGKLAHILEKRYKLHSADMDYKFLAKVI